MLLPDEVREVLGLLRGVAVAHDLVHAQVRVRAVPEHTHTHTHTSKQTQGKTDKGKSTNERTQQIRGAPVQKALWSQHDDTTKRRSLKKRKTSTFPHSASSSSRHSYVRETDAARDAAELFDEDNVLEVAEPEAAKLGGRSGTEKASVTELAPEILFLFCWFA